MQISKVYEYTKSTFSPKIAQKVGEGYASAVQPHLLKLDVHGRLGTVGHIERCTLTVMPRPHAVPLPKPHQKSVVIPKKSSECKIAQESDKTRTLLQEEGNKFLKQVFRWLLKVTTLTKGDVTKQ